MGRQKLLAVVAVLCCVAALSAAALQGRQLLTRRDRPASPAPRHGPAALAPRYDPASQAPREGALLGAWVRSPEGHSPALRMRAVARLERQLGRRLDIDHHFYPWDKPFPTEEERWDLAQGRIPMISWNGTHTDLVADGAFDGLIRERAAGLRALGRPVLLRWFWEMDVPGDRPAAASPASFVAAWRHLHGVFEAAGASNVAWVWCPTAAAFAGKGPAAWYPGDRYVDWICADGYNWAPGRPGDRWRSFEEIFAAFYRWGAGRDKPLMIAEFGVQERHPGEKAGWLRAAGASLKRRFPRIAAVVYFSSRKDYDWWLGSSPGALAAFRAVATDPYFNRRG